MSCLGRTTCSKAWETVRRRKNFAPVIGLPASPVYRHVSRSTHALRLSCFARGTFTRSATGSDWHSIGRSPSLSLPSHVAFRFYTRQTTQKFLNVDDCTTIQELLHTTREKLDQLPLTAVAAVWSRLPRLLSNHPAILHHHLDTKHTHGSHANQGELEVFSLVEYTMNSLHSSTPKDLTTIILGMAKIVKHIRDEKRHRNRSFNENYQRAFTQFILDAESNPKEDIFHTLAQTANDLLPRFNSRELSNLAYAYALLGCDPKLDNHDTLFQQIAVESIHRIHRFNAQDLSNLMWAYATIKVSHPILFRSVGDVVVGLPDLDAFKPQEISILVWAFATANQSHPTLFEKIGDAVAALDHLSAYNPQELSNLVWAYATLNESHSGLFDKVALAIDSLSDLKAFAPQTFSNIVWAYATAGQRNPYLFEKIGDAIGDLEDLRSFTPQAFSNTLWAYCKANESHNSLFEKIGNSIVALNNLNAFTPQELSNTLWALAIAKVKSTNLFEKIGDALLSRHDISTFTPQNLSNIVWAYSKANEAHAGLFKRVGDTIIARDDLRTFTPQNIVNTVWAFAAANELRPDVFKKIGDAIVETNDLKSFSARGLASLAWSYAVSNVDVPLVFNHQFIGALLEKQHDFDENNLRQLYQWHLWQTGEESKLGLPKGLQERCRHTFIDYHVTTSALQEDAVGELLSIGLNPMEEVLTQSGYRLDALVEVGGKKVGIEVDGPSHYIGGTGTVNGSTILKHRQVSTIDKISIVSVPYWEWNKFGNDRSKKQDYLRSILVFSE